MNATAPARLARLHEALGVDVLNLAHRGARAYAPENTLPAFQKAHGMGCDMVELDVHLCADGTPVVHHDDDLTRCTDVQLRYPGRAGYFVSDFSSSEIASLDAGSWFAREVELEAPDRQRFLRGLTAGEMSAHIDGTELLLYKSGNVRVPTLDAALELVRDCGLCVNIEIKTMPRMYPEIAQKVLQCIVRYGLSEKTLISSFDHEQLFAVRQANSDIATAVLTSDRLANVAGYLELLDADAFHPGCYDNFDSLGFGSVSGQLETRSISDVRAAGKHVNVWTCNDKPQMKLLMAAGVTGIITDYPNRLSDVIA